MEKPRSVLASGDDDPGGIKSLKNRILKLFYALKIQGLVRNQTLRLFFRDLIVFTGELLNFIKKVFHLSFFRFEKAKGIFVGMLYRQRGKHAKKFIHTGMAALSAFGVIIAPVVAQEFPGRNLNPSDVQSPSAAVLSASSFDSDIATDISIKPRDKIIEYTVVSGDTVSSIADKFGVSKDTVLWQNNLGDRDPIKPGQTLKILPVTGVSHKVQKGDTVYSIAKIYDSSPQAIVDFPFNTFVNDETFELAIGEIIIVPDGVKSTAEKPVAPRTRQMTPDAGTVVASGSFVWPTQGTITQRFSWYHKAIDIANRSLPAVLAADSGTVIFSGWSNDGYGYHVIIDHGNGYKTLYGHMSKLMVNVGQTVSRGSQIGVMGSTGHSTGPHLHFEVIKNGVYLNPLSVLK